MKIHFDEELKKVKSRLLKMGLLVEYAIANASTSILERNSTKAEEVIKKDEEINLYEIEIDEFAHELMARYQPTATDLRLMTMILKITNDLERMGDQAANIAQRALQINGEPPVIEYDKFARMSDLVLQMVRDSLDAFMEGDMEKAKNIMKTDDLVDELDDQITADVFMSLKDQPDNVETGVSLILVARNFERLADLATNVAEDVIYVKKGVDVRHHIRERRNDALA